MADLLGELASNSAALIRDEIDLARQEMRENALKLRPRFVAVAIGATSMGVAFLVFSAAAVIALGGLIGFALSAVVIGSLLALIGGLTTLIGVRRIKQTSLKPRQTIETLEEDKSWLRGLR